MTMMLATELTYAAKYGGLTSILVILLAGLFIAAALYGKALRRERRAIIDRDRAEGALQGTEKMVENLQATRELLTTAAKATQKIQDLARAAYAKSQEELREALTGSEASLRASNFEIAAMRTASKEASTAMLASESALDNRLEDLRNKLIAARERIVIQDAASAKIVDTTKGNSEVTQKGFDDFLAEHAERHVRVGDLEAQLEAKETENVLLTSVCQKLERELAENTEALSELSQKIEMGKNIAPAQFMVAYLAKALFEGDTASMRKAAKVLSVLDREVSKMQEAGYGDAEDHEPSCSRCESARSVVYGDSGTPFRMPCPVCRPGEAAKAFDLLPEPIQKEIVEKEQQATPHGCDPACVQCRGAGVSRFGIPCPKCSPAAFAAVRAQQDCAAKADEARQATQPAVSEGTPCPSGPAQRHDLDAGPVQQCSDSDCGMCHGIGTVENDRFDEDPPCPRCRRVAHAAFEVRKAREGKADDDSNMNG